MNIFEKASRLKLRFEVEKGNVNTEDLWDMPLLPTLDNIAKDLNQQCEQSVAESFVMQNEKSDDTLEFLKFSIVKYIIRIKLQEKAMAEDEAAKKIKKEKILSILAKKEDIALEENSIDDLRKMLDDL